MDDIIELIIYIAIGVVGLLASAYRNKQKRQSQQRRIPRDIDSGPMPEVHPDLGPLAEIFGIPEINRPVPVQVPEPIVQSIEEEGNLVEEEGFWVEKAGYKSEYQSEGPEKEGINFDSVDSEGTPVFESTQKTMISDTIIEDSIMDMSDIYVPISDSEIKGVDEVEKNVDNEVIDWKKAVIYSEILKSRGN